MVNRLSTFTNATIEAFNKVTNDKTYLQGCKALYYTSILVAAYSSTLFFSLGLTAGMTYKCAHICNNKAEKVIGYSLMKILNRNRFTIALVSDAAFVMNRFVSNKQFAHVLGKVYLAHYAPRAIKACAFGAKYLPAVVAFIAGYNIVFARLQTGFRRPY